MTSRKNIFISVAVVGLAAVFGVVGLGLAGGFDSGDSLIGGTPEPTSSPSPTVPPSGSTPTVPPPSETPTGDPGGVSSVTPDPDFRSALRGAGISTSPWKTDFSLHTVPFDEITPVLGPDGIPAIADPDFVTLDDADRWLGPQEPVIAFEIDGDARAYPLQILTWHEIVNDIVGGVPVAVTFCPLCNSAIVFDRRFDGEVFDFGVSGNLRNSDLIMFDRQTHTWWQQFTGEGIVGQFAGRQLTLLPGSIISWEDFKGANPEGIVLSRDTGFRRPYGENPYAGYDRVDNPPFLFDGDTDGRLLPKERVLAVTVNGVDAAFPFSILEEEKVVHYTVGGKELVVFFKAGTNSALDQRSIRGSKDVGATGVFEPELGGRKLTFRAEGDGFVDEGTGSVWNILGEAVEGPLAGETLSPVVHANHFWFAWGAFKPDTEIFRGAAG